MKAFTAPKESVGSLDADSASTLIAAATDIALVIDSNGVIRDLAFNGDDLYPALSGYEKWIGRAWTDVVTIESRPKVESLLREAMSDATPRWRQMNHASARGADVPVLYSAVQLGRKGRIVAFGRDLRELSALQQRLVEAQQSLERDYIRLRHVEARYRLLFQMSTEAVLIVDATTEKVVDANPAARQMFGEAGGRMLGRLFRELFDTATANAIQDHLATVRAGGKANDLRLDLADPKREVRMSTTLFRQENASLYLVQLTGAPDMPDAHALPSSAARLVTVVENAPDGLVVTDAEQRIVAANTAFLSMIQMAAEDQVKGQPLDRWVGRPGVDLNVLIANLRQRGSVRLFATKLRGEFGGSVNVEISAAAIVNGGQPGFGLWIRNVDRRLTGEGVSGHPLPRSVEQLKELIGRISLKELVRESTDLIERLCIEAALELTGDNRASAAEMLGLSRQSLYVKLRRYNLGDLAVEGEN